MDAFEPIESNGYLIRKTFNNHASSKNKTYRFSSFFCYLRCPLLYLIIISAICSHEEFYFAWVVHVIYFLC